MISKVELELKSVYIISFLKAGDEGKISNLRNLTRFPTTPSKQNVADVAPSIICMFIFINTRLQYINQKSSK